MGLAASIRRRRSGALSRQSLEPPIPEGQIKRGRIRPLRRRVQPETPKIFQAASLEAVLCIHGFLRRTIDIEAFAPAQALPKSSMPPSAETTKFSVSSWQRP